MRPDSKRIPIVRLSRRIGVEHAADRHHRYGYVGEPFDPPPPRRGEATVREPQEQQGGNQGEAGYPRPRSQPGHPLPEAGRTRSEQRSPLRVGVGRRRGREAQADHDHQPADGVLASPGCQEGPHPRKEHTDQRDGAVEEELG